MKYIWIRLASPFQAWGGDAISFEIRPTNEMPTFSGIIGFLCSCLGISFRNDLNEVLFLRNNLMIDIYSFKKSNIVLKDYQSAGNNFNKKDKCQKRKIPKPGNQIYTKHYLQDCKFDIILKTENESLTSKIVLALHKPKWFPFLGRKSCHLTELPFKGLFSSMEEIEEIWKEKNIIHVKKLLHVKKMELMPNTIKDYPLCKGDNSTTFRYVREIECL